jgi:ElaB/YqjD/DUF883 family membrane-anchored ribosome-binding protein
MTDEVNTSEAVDSDVAADEAGSAENIPAAERLEAARQKVVQVASGMRDGAGKAGAQIKEGAGRATKVARDKYVVAKEKVGQGYDKVSKDMDQLSQDVNEYVRANPGKSVLIAAAVGFFLGALMRGGRRG